MGQENTLLDCLLIFLRRKKVIITLILLSVGGAFIYIALTPEIYRAESRILPPSRSESTSAAMLSQLGLGGISGLPVSQARGAMLIEILRSQFVVDKIIDRFDLMTLYKEDSRLRIRASVVSGILQAAEDTRSSVITVAVLDKDPVRAAQMTNAFIEELRNAMQSLAIGEAAQRRLFFEQQMLQARRTLDEAEDELQKYQEESGLVAMDPQVAAMVSSIANLRAQVAAKEVELSSLRTFASANNPNLRRAESELAALRSELEKLEQEQASTDGDTSMISLRDAPQLGLEYRRRVRDVQYATTLFELMLRQFEGAKIDESREAMVIQILDLATPPDYKFKPKKGLIVLFATLLGLCFGTLWALFAHYVECLKNDPEQAQVLKEIRASFSLRKQI